MPRAFKQKLSRTVNQPFRPFLNARRSILAAKKKRFLGFMGRLSFDAVDTLIYDPVSANRTATRAALYSLGFRRTETVPTLENFVARIQKSPPDLALCEQPYQALEGADVLAIVTEWKLFRSPDFAAIRAALKEPAIFDGRNLYEPALVEEAGLAYYGIGRGRSLEARR